jgi:hypothetical protein
MSIFAQACFGTYQIPLHTMLAPLALRRLTDTSVICAACGSPCDCWAGSIYGEDGEENQCNACCDKEVLLADPVYMDALTVDNEDPSGDIGATAAYMLGKAIGNGKGNGKGMQGKAIGKPMKGKGKGHASIRCCDSEESSSDSQQASLLPMLRTAAGVLMSASEAEIEQATSAYNDVLAGTMACVQSTRTIHFQTAYNLRHGMACAAYNAMTVYWQGKAKGKGKGMKGDKETMASEVNDNCPSLYNEMTMAFEAAKALEQGKRTHRSRSPRSHH